MTLVGKNVSSQSKRNTQSALSEGLAHREKACNRVLGDPGSESELLASESARVLHSEAGLLDDRLPSFQLSGERVANEDILSLGLFGGVTGGRIPGKEVLPGGVNCLARVSAWGLHNDSILLGAEPQMW